MLSQISEKRIFIFLLNKKPTFVSLSSVIVGCRPSTHQRMSFGNTSGGSYSYGESGEGHKMGISVASSSSGPYGPVGVDPGSSVGQSVQAMRKSARDVERRLGEAIDECTSQMEIAGSFDVVSPLLRHAQALLDQVRISPPFIALCGPFSFFSLLASYLHLLR